MGPPPRRSHPHPPPNSNPPPRNSPPCNSPPRNSTPRNSPPPNSPEPPREGDISKFKPDVTYDGTGDIDALFFALKQSLQAYNLNSRSNQLLAFGRSLREGALNWWRLSYRNYNTLHEAATGLETAFRDKSKPQDHVRKINNLSRTSSIHNFFLEVDRLNIQAQLPEEALWKILKGNLRPDLCTALASLRPKPSTYLEWRQAALEIGSELDAEHSTRTTNPRQSSTSQKRPRESTKETSTKRQKKDNEWVPKEKRDQRRERGACLDCG